MSFRNGKCSYCGEQLANKDDCIEHIEQNHFGGHTTTRRSQAL